MCNDPNARQGVQKEYFPVPQQQSRQDLSSPPEQNYNQQVEEQRSSQLQGQMHYPQVKVRNHLGSYLLTRSLLGSVIQPSSRHVFSNLSSSSWSLLWLEALPRLGVPPFGT